MKKSFARQNEGLYALLNTLGQRQQAAESAADRELKKEQLRMQMEELRATSSLTKEQLGLERMKVESNIKMQDLQFKIAINEHEVSMLNAKIQGRQSIQAMTLAQAEESRRISEEARNVTRFASELGQTQINASIQAGALLQGKIDRHDATVAKAAQERGLSEEVLMGMLGVYSRGGGVSEDGQSMGAESFTVSPGMEDLMENYIKQNPVLNPKDPNAQLAAARQWVVGIRNAYGTLLKAKMEEINATRTANGEQPIASLDQLETEQAMFVKEQLANKAFATFMKSKDGPLATAVLGKIGQGDLAKLVKEYGVDGAYAQLLNGISVDKGKVHVNNPRTNPKLDSLGRNGASIFVDETYGKIRGNLDVALPKFFDSDYVVQNDKHILIGLHEDQAVNDDVILGHQKAIANGDWDGLSPGEIQEITLVGKKARGVYMDPTARKVTEPGKEDDNPVDPERYVRGFFDMKNDVNMTIRKSGAFGTSAVPTDKVVVNYVMHERYGLAADVEELGQKIGGGIEKGLNKQTPNWFNRFAGWGPDALAYTTGNEDLYKRMNDRSLDPTWMDLLKLRKHQNPNLGDTAQP